MHELFDIIYMCVCSFNLRSSLKLSLLANWVIEFKDRLIVFHHIIFFFILRWSGPPNPDIVPNSNSYQFNVQNCTGFVNIA